MRKKTILTGALLFCIGLAGWPAVADTSDIQLIINHQLYTQTENQMGPVLREDRVYVPLRLVGEALGHQVRWVEAARQVQISTKDDFPEQEITAVAEDAPVTIQIDGEELQTDSFTGIPYLSETGQTMIPLRLVGEALHCQVQWQDGVVIVEEIPAEPVQTEETAETHTEGSQYETITILGDSIATAEQLNRYLEQKEDDVRAMMERNYPEQGFTPFPEHIAEYYIEIGKKYHIRGDLAFAQALKETGYFQFYGSVQAFQNNFCGLGASGVENTGEEPLNGVDETRVYSIPGLHGLTFQTVADGVEAHIQHLYAYATQEELPEGCELLDPRFGYVKRGAAERWIDLNGRWAVPGNGYGESIINDYWLPALQQPGSSNK